MNLFRLLPALFLAATLSASDLHWGTDLDAGRKQAAKAHKALVVFFTGSAWCPPCKVLHAELLPSKAFADFAQDKVLVMLDYPPLSGRTDEKVKADPALGKLMKLKEEHKVPGFPTMLLVGPDGKERGRKSGFGKGQDPAAYLADLQKGS